jgi:H+/Cl- antiporter ClcA
MPSVIRISGVAVLIGAVIGPIFLGFEWLVKHGTGYLWNDLLHTDTARWLVVPVAIGLSLAFSLMLRGLKQPRLTEPETDLLKDGGIEIPTHSLAGLARIFLVGLASLLAGASLGPEASLVALSIGMAGWLSKRTGESAAVQLLALSAVGALLVAFLGSLVPIILPILLMLKQRDIFTPPQFIVPVLTGLATSGSILLIQGDPAGFGTLPVNGTLAPIDYGSAFALGLVMTLVAAFLRRQITRFYVHTAAVAKRVSWPLAATLFGAVLGALYLIGGPTVQFSGSDGTTALIRDPAAYGPLALGGLVLIKAVVTGWSLTAGYRGGLVFPSIYMGTAMGLCASSLFSGFSEVGVALGSIGGIIAAMTSPVLAAIILASLLPVSLLAGAMTGVLGAFIGHRLMARIAGTVAPASVKG